MPRGQRTEKSLMQGWKANSPRQGPAQVPLFGKRPDPRAHLEHLTEMLSPAMGAQQGRFLPSICPTPQHQRGAGGDFTQPGAQVLAAAAQGMTPPSHSDQILY